MMTYPTISHFIKNLTGSSEFIHLPIQTFGFFIVVAFIIGHYVIKKGFLRLESRNEFQPIKTAKQETKKRPNLDYIFNGIFAFFFGYKILYIINHWVEFSMDPQKILFSKDGHFLLGLIFLIINLCFIYFDEKNTKNI